MIVMDLEWNYGPASEQELASGDTLKFEIIQVGAVMVDKQGNILKTFERLVAPIVHPVIHSKITELTGITEKKLEGCPDFGTVWQDFCKFSEEDFSEGKREIIFWGNCDRAVLLSNLLYHGFEQEENLQLYDLQALFDRAVLKSSQQSALSTALTALKLTPYGQYHSALSDAVNAASILKALGGEDFVQKNLHKVVLRKRSGKTKSNEEGTLLLQKTFYGITDIASLKPEFEPELGSCLNAPFQEVLPGFYRNHKKIWAYRSRDQLIKVTSRSYPAQDGKGKDFVVKFYQIDRTHLEQLRQWSNKQNQYLSRRQANGHSARAQRGAR